MEKTDTASQFGWEGGWLTAVAVGGRRSICRDIFNLLLPLALSKMSFFLNILLYCCLCWSVSEH